MSVSHGPGKFLESSEHVKRKMFGHFLKNISAIVAGDLSLRSFADVFFLFSFEKQQNKLNPWSICTVNTKRDHCGWTGGGDLLVEEGVQGSRGGRGTFSQRLTPAVLSAGG